MSSGSIRTFVAANRGKLALGAGALFLLLVVVFSTLARAQEEGSGCAPRSTLDCSAVVKSAPVELDFGGDAGGLADKSGVGTGFTMTDPPSARISADGAPSNPEVPGYEPGKLTVQNGSLTISSNKGLAYKEPSTSANTNSQINTLGVGFDASEGDFAIRTSLPKPAFPSQNSFQQGGLWFGLDEDNYVKIVVGNTGNGNAKIQMVREIDAQSGGANTPDERNTANNAVPGSGTPIDLSLTISAPAAGESEGEISGAYKIGSNAPQTFAPMTLPAKFFAGEPVAESSAETASFAGVFGSHRNASSAMDFTFENFSVAEIDATPPAAPQSLSASAGDGQVELDWDDNAENDLAGYNVYRSTSPDVDTSGQPVNGGAPLADSAYADSGVENGRIYHYAVVAVDAAGNASGAATASAMPDVAASEVPGFQLPFAVNFQSESAPVPEGYEEDFGENYSNARGFGWVEPGSGAPLSLVGNGRDRNLNPDQRLDTVMHAQGDDVPSFPASLAKEGAWEISLPDGSYDVQVAAGDPSVGSDAEVHSVNVEGQSAIEGFEPAGSAGADSRHEIATVEGVEVTDGRLTVDAGGGTNTKLNYLVVSEAQDPVQNQPPQVTDPGDQSSAEGDEVALQIQAADPDAGDTLAYEATGLPPGLSIGAESGEISGTIAAGAAANSPYAATVTATDSGDPAESASAEFAWNISEAAEPEDTEPPELVSTSPAAGAVGVAAAANVSAAFSEAMDASTIDGSTFTLSGENEPVPASVSYEPEGDQAVLDPEGELAAGATYTAELDAANITDAAGNALGSEAITWQFTTEAPADTTAPDPVSGLALDPAPERIKLSWNASPSNDVAGYNVYRSEDATDFTKLTADPVEATTYDDTTAPVGQGVYYQVRAVDAAGNESAPRSRGPVERPASEDTTAPAAPKSLSATGEEPGVALNWNDNTEGDLAGYNVYRSASFGGGYEKLNAELLVASDFEDGEAPVGAVSYYRVTAVDASGNESKPAINDAIRPADTTAPAAPANLSASAGDGQVELAWDAVEDWDLAGYNVYRDGEKITGSTPVSANSYTDGTAENGTEYSYTVAAVDGSNNESGQSAAATATPEDPDAAKCPPRSTLACENVAVEKPVALEFSGDEGGLAAGNDADTGFTMVDPPSARLAADDPVSNPDVPGYEPGRLSVGDGLLSIESTKGIMYKQPSTLANTNSQLNALGVGVDATGGESGAATVIETTIRKPAFPSTAQAQQGGLWFGLDEDNYAKIVVFNQGSGNVKLQMVREIDANSANTTNPDTTDERNSDNLAVANGTPIDLALVVTPPAAGEESGTVAGTYQVQGGPGGELAPMTLPAKLFEGEPVAEGAGDSASFAGVFATHRNGSVPITAAFEDFSVTADEEPADAEAPTVESTTPADGATDVAVDANASATFSEELDPATVDAGSFTLAAAGASDPVAASVSYAPGAGAVLDPDADLENGTEYTATVKGGADGVADLAGNPLAENESWTFTTAAADEPQEPSDDVSLGFDAATPDTIPDKDDEGTGFTLVQESTNGGGYLKENLDIKPATGVLDITTTSGIQYKTASDGTNNTSGSKGNGLNNALGVDFDAEGGETKLSTTLVDPPSGTNTFQQGGLWFGPGEDDYVKLVVTTQGVDNQKIQLVREVGGVSGGATSGDEVNLPAAQQSDWSDDAVELILTLDASGSAAASYSVNGGPEQSLGQLGNIPQSWFAADSEAGIFATHRNHDGPLVFAFDDFDLTAPEGGGGEPGPDPEPAPDFAGKVNFQNETASLPGGYLKDFGQAYGERAGADQGEGLSYGWVEPGTSTPVDLSTGGSQNLGNGRDRNLNGDQRLDTLMHMQAGSSTYQNPFNGKTADGAWEIAVPDGSYEVTVAAGDASVNSDPESHSINVEGQSLISGFEPTGSAGADSRHQTATETVSVSDGRLTVDAQGGTNTKINYIDIQGAEGGEPAPDNPSVAGSDPADGETNVALSTAISTTSLRLVGSGVDNTTLSSETVKLIKVSDGSQVPANVNGTGGGDAITLTPTNKLEKNTEYRFEITAGVKDLDGLAFEPYAATFTTGETDAFNPPGVSNGDVGNAAFDRVSLPGATGTGETFTSVTMGPDDRLYAATVEGDIYSYASDEATGELSDKQIISTVKDENGGNRLIMGLTFEPGSTAAAPRLWITHSSFGYVNQPDWTGKLSVLSGSDLGEYRDVVTNLPRSSKDHLTNSIEFKGGKIYIPIGATTAMGAYDNAWKGTERLLSAAVVEIDYQSIGGTLDAKTADGGSYDPYAPGAPVSLYATGVRNAVDLVWHSNGELYVPTNGSAGGSNAPATPAGYEDTEACKTLRADGPYTGPSVPDFDGDSQGPFQNGKEYDPNTGELQPRMKITKTQEDYLYRVEKDGYYGNPNPVRCEWVLNGGNPTSAADPGENPAYPVGTEPDRNWRGWAYNFELNQSPNGAIEYRSNNFGGKLKGKLLVARYSKGDDIIVLHPTDPNGPNKGDVVQHNIGVPGLAKSANGSSMVDPLDLTEDTRNGNLYVTEGVSNPPNGSGKITLLKARDTGDPEPGEVTLDPKRLVTSAVSGQTSAPQDVEIQNTGTSSLNLEGLEITGANAGQFQVVGGPASYPVELAPGETLTVQVAFKPASAGVKTANLTVDSDAPAATTPSVELRGLGTKGTGGSNEPSLQQVLDVYDLPINTGDDDPATNAIHSQSGQQKAPLLGDEIEAQTFTQAGSNPVEVEPLSVFGPDADNPVVEFGHYAAGDKAGKQELFTVSNDPKSNAQTVNVPANGNPSFEAPGAEFGFYSVWPFFNDREVYSEDALNDFTGAIPHHVRAYPVPGEQDAYVIATEEHVQGFDYQDVVVIVRGVTPVEPPAEPEAEISISPDELVFDGVQGSNNIPTKSIEVENTGDSPLELSGSGITGPNGGSFSVVGDAPGSVPAGESAEIEVKFAPPQGTVGSLSAALAIESNDADEPTTEVGLYGLSTKGLEGGNEPTLQDVVNTLGYPFDAHDLSGNPLTFGTDAAMKGDEVPAQLFKKAGSGPVGMTPIARYSPNEALPFGYYTLENGNPQETEVDAISNGEFQTLYPETAGGNDAFDPGDEKFGVFVDSLTFGRKSYQQDALNESNPTKHAVRVYPAVNRAGDPIPNTYIATFEDASNGDYQDYVFLMTNVQPASAPEPGGGSGGEVASVNFQQSGFSTPAGYEADTGQGFSEARGYGWVNGSGSPVSKTADTRTRTTPANPLLQSLVIVDNAAVTSVTNGEWEYAVPDGTYDVTVTAGDGGFTDSTHTVEVEGQTAIDGFTPTTAQPFATETVSAQVTDGRLTVAGAGQNVKLTHVEISGQAGPTEPDTTAPEAGIQLSGGQNPDGAYLNRAQVTVEATDEGGSGVESVAYSLDGAPYEPYGEPFFVEEPGEHTIKARVVDGAGNATTTGTETFEIVQSDAEIGLQNADATRVNGEPAPGLYDDWMTFSRLNSTDTPQFQDHLFHDTGTLTIQNTGQDDALNVTGLSISNSQFELVDAPQLPLAIAPGGSEDVTVKFVASGAPNKSIRDAQLTIQSDDADEAETVVELRGAYMNAPEGSNEVTATQIARAFGYETAIGEPLTEENSAPLAGDEVRSKLWKRADASEPVYARQLAAYHGCPGSNGISIAGQNVAHDPAYCQSLLPLKNNASTPAEMTVNPTGNFAINSSGYTTNTDGNLGIRTFPVKDRDGKVVPHAWYVIQDFVQSGCGGGSANCDYQDNTFLVTNVMPVSPSDTAAPAAPAGLAAEAPTDEAPKTVALDWADNSEADLAGYNVYRSTEEGGDYEKLNNKPLAASEYADESAPAGETVYYRVTAADTAGNESDPSATASVETPAGEPEPEPEREPVRINAGGAAQSVNGTGWAACSSAGNCSGYVTGGNAYSENDTNTGIPAGMNNAIFQSEWTGGQASGLQPGQTAFTFDVPVEDGYYDVVLHFAELNKFQNNLRLFDVEVEDELELNDYDVHAEAGGANKAVSETIPVEVADGEATIEFVTVKENAKISAIEVLPTDDAPPADEAPAAPTGLAASAGDGEISLDWTDNSEADLAGYNVYRSESENGTYEKLNGQPVEQSGYTDSTATGGQSYFYKVSAVDAAGEESQQSAAASAGLPGAGGFTQITWSNAGADQPFGNSEGQSEVVGGKMYTFGGFDSQKSCCTPTDRAYVYSPQANGWSAIADMPAQNGTGNGGVTHAGFATDGEDIYWAGGYTANNAGTGQIFGTNEVFKYDVSGDSYSKLPNLPAARAGGQLEYLGGKLYYFGGTNQARTQDVGNLYVLDLGNPGAGWSELAEMPNGRHHLASGVVGGKIYAIGGQKAHDGALVPQDDVHVYDPATDQWKGRADMPTGRNHASSSTVTLNGRIIVVGGQVDHGTGVDDVTAYDPQANAWVELTPLPQARHSGMAGVIDSVIYFTTGNGSKATLKGVPEGVTPPPVDDEAPEVTDVSPADGAENVSAGTEVTATFSEAMAPGTINASTFTLTGEGEEVPASVAYDAQSETATLDPEGSLEAGADYTATITTGAEDAAGNGLAEDYGWSFNVQGAEPEPEPAGKVVARINTGGPAVTTGGAEWQADQHFDGGKTMTQNVPIAGTADDALYQSERSATADLGGFGYDIPVPEAGEYTIRLHMAEIWFTGAAGKGPSGGGKRVFSANAEGGPAELQGYDLNADVGPETASVKSYEVTVEDGTLNIDFGATTNRPTIGAIEVIQKSSEEPPPDTEAPEVSIDSGPSGTTGSDSATFEFSANEPGATFECKLDDAPFEPCSSPAKLSGLANGQHTFSVRAADAAGNVSEPASQSWTVNVDDEPPSVTGVSPENGDTDVPVGTDITATFSEAMDPASIDAQSFKLAEPGGGAVPASVAYDAQSDEATLDPNGALKEGATYEATITTAATDEAGNGLAAPESWSFTTAEAAPEPEPGEPGEALLVAGSTSLNAADAAIEDELQDMGYDVTVESAAGTAASSAAGKDAVLVSSTVSGATVGAKFRNVQTPVITWEMVQFNPANLGMTAANANGRASGQSQVSIADPDHPLAGGLSAGNKPVLTSGTTPMTWGAPGASAEKVATLAGNANNATVFGYEEGDQMQGLTAPERRVGLYLHDMTAANSNANGWTLFRAAVEWASNTETSEPEPEPDPEPEPIRINAGGPAQTVSGTEWLGCATAGSCNGYVSGGFKVGWNKPVTGAEPPANQAIYQTEWTGGEKGPQSTIVPVGQTAFSFDVPVEDGSYEVRLHFAEMAQDAAGDREFDVEIEGNEVLSDYDIYEAANGANKAVVEEFTGEVTDGEMSIDFIRQVENAKIDGIEIIPVSGGSATDTGPSLMAYSLSASPSTLNAGGATTLSAEPDSGKASTFSTAARDAGQRVILESRPVGESGFTRVPGKAVTADAGETVEFGGIKPRESTDYRVRTVESGSSEVGPAERVRVKSGVTQKLSAAKIKPGKGVVVSGRVSPAHAGETVRVTIKQGARTVAAKTVKLSRNSAYRFVYKPKKPGVYRVTTRFSGDADHLGAASPARTFRVIR